MQNGLSIIICSHKSDILRLDKVIKYVKAGCVAINHEIIIVSNGGQNIASDEFDNRYVSVFGCKVIHVAEGNLGLARRIGLDNSSYEVVMFIDDDNLVVPDYIKYAYQKLVSDSTTSIVGCLVGPTDEVRSHLLNLFGKRAAIISKLLAIDLTEDTLNLDFQNVSSVYGAGMCSTRNFLKRIFKSNLICAGRSGSFLLSGDDTEICFKALKYGNIYRWNKYGIFHEINLSRINNDYIKKLSGNMLLTLPFLHYIYWRNKYTCIAALVLSAFSSLIVSVRFSLNYKCSIGNYFLGLLFCVRNK